MTKGKHSYVPFYMDDWRGGTSDMPRLMWSVYFQVCMYNWDKVEPVPEARVRIMLADLPGDQGANIIAGLIDAECLCRDERGVFSTRALAEGAKALAAWEAKSRGGRGKGGSTKPEHSSKPVEAGIEAGSIDSDSDSDSEESKTSPPQPPTKSELVEVVECWNKMAAMNGLSQVVAMNDVRTKSLTNRISDHGAASIKAGIANIPNSRFLMGRTGEPDPWKANFDWLLTIKGCTKLLEGQFHNRGDQNGENNGNGTGDAGSGNAYVRAAVEREAARTAGEQRDSGGGAEHGG